MRKAEWKARAKDAEARLTVLNYPAPLTYDTLMICFSGHTFTLRGSVIHVDQDCVSIPLTNDQHLLAPAGWYPIGSGVVDS